jgi:leucyl aminopeptidase
MEGKTGQILLLPSTGITGVQRLLLVGCGKESEMNERSFERVIDAIASTLASTGARDAEIYPGEIPLKGRDLAWKVRQASLLLNNSEYRFDSLKSDKPAAGKGLRKLAVNVAKKDAALATQAIAEASAISAGMTLTRDLGNLPANICTPTYLARQARDLARGDKRLRVSVLEEADMKRLKMGSLLSVSAGSRQPAKLITIEYRGAAAAEQPVVLVGKGVTFDTGGISLKPGQAMDEMKYDMCGAASVFGTLKAVAQMQLAINVVGIIPTTENMPDGIATKPGDIVTSMSGQTIEILNTDAEGRKIQAPLRDRHRYPYRRRYHRARQNPIGSNGQQCRTDQRLDQVRAPDRRQDLGIAIVGRVPGPAEEQFRRYGEYRWARWRQHHRRLLPGALHPRLQMGAPRHRRYRLEIWR